MPDIARLSARRHAHRLWAYNRGTSHSGLRCACGAVVIGKPTDQHAAFSAAEFRDVRPTEPCALCGGTRWLNNVERCPWCEQRVTDRKEIK